MKLKLIFIFIFLLAAPLSAVAQPTITLPPDQSPPSPATPPADQPRNGIPRPSYLQLPRESQIEVPLDQRGLGGATALGGYGELTFNAPSSAPNIVDLRRLVLYVGHNFTERLRLYAEVEMEHAVTSSTDKGE